MVRGLFDIMTNKHICPKCSRKKESISADVPRWKVIWEERREVIVKAESPEEAERMVSEGRYGGRTNDAVTVLPYALPIGD
jgi:hypothetical protein